MRISGLDFLRGCAIILVLFRHGDVSNVITNFGWLGVDLFFVLSGFLVSGLLFREYLRQEKVSIKRFLIRRGFKIYPAFYIFVLFSVALHYYQTKSFYRADEILPEIFYLQSYLPHIWDHTWSLAVEEHFYLLLALAVPIWIKTKRLENRKFMISTFCGILVLTFLMRFWVSWPHRHEDFFPFSQTHLRMDGIVIGVFCAYLFYFTDFYASFLKQKYLWAALAALLILPGFFFDGGVFFMNTFGLTSVNLGFGILLLLALQEHPASSLFHRKFFALPIRFMCFIGIHSYSIYLWHLTAKTLVLSFGLGERRTFALYILCALVLGILLSYLIERPFLKLRDRLYK